MAEGMLPITIVTGFLGSGKTTILSHWLACPAFERTAVIVNEFGKVGLDQRVLRRVEEKTVLLSGGCACCNVRDDLVRELGRMIDSRDKGELDIDRVVIETTGLADPAPILFSILTNPVLRHHYAVDCVVTCLDAVNGTLQLGANVESVKQIAVADRVILTKTDLTDEAALPALLEQVYAINPAVTVFRADMGVIDPEEVLTDKAAFGGRSLSKLQRSFAVKTRHETQVQSISVTFDNSIHWSAFGLWLSALLYAHGENIYRIKGIMDTGAEGPVLLNGVQHIIHPPEHLDGWGEEEHRSELVFIMKEIDPKSILTSLDAFERILGAQAHIREINCVL